MTEQTNEQSAQAERPTNPPPSIGCIVHYRKGGQKPRPAMIVDVHSDTCVDLVVYGTAHPAAIGVTGVNQIDPDEGVGVGWYWPPRA